MYEEQYEEQSLSGADSDRDLWGHGEDLQMFSESDDEQPLCNLVVEEEEPAVEMPDRCRLCAFRALRLVHIFGPEGRELQLDLKIQACLPIKVWPDESETLLVCRPCVLRLDACYRFVLACLQAQSDLGIKSCENNLHGEAMQVPLRVANILYSDTLPTREHATELLASSIRQLARRIASKDTVQSPPTGTPRPLLPRHTSSKPAASTLQSSFPSVSLSTVKPQAPQCSLLIPHSNKVSTTTEEGIIHQNTTSTPQGFLLIPSANDATTMMKVGTTSVNTISPQSFLFVPPTHEGSTQVQVPGNTSQGFVLIPRPDKEPTTVQVAAATRTRITPLRPILPRINQESTTPVQVNAATLTSLAPQRSRLPRINKGHTLKAKRTKKISSRVKKSSDISLLKKNQVKTLKRAPKKKPLKRKAPTSEPVDVETKNNPSTAQVYQRPADNSPSNTESSYTTAPISISGKTILSILKPKSERLQLTNKPSQEQCVISSENIKSGALTSEGELLAAGSSLEEASNNISDLPQENNYRSHGKLKTGKNLKHIADKYNCSLCDMTDMDFQYYKAHAFYTHRKWVCKHCPENIADTWEEFQQGHCLTHRRMLDQAKFYAEIRKNKLREPTDCAATRKRRELRKRPYGVPAPIQPPVPPVNDPTKWFSCSYCDQTFSKFVPFRSHMKYQHDKYVCRFCPGIEMDGYIQSNAEHNKEGSSCLRKPDEQHHVCPECGQKFRAPNQLRYHMNRHKNINSCLCDLCGKSFSCPASLRGHTVRVHEQRKYPCKLCSKVLTTARRFNQHFLLFHSSGLWRFQCKLCAVVVTSESLAEEHVATTHPGRGKLDDIFLKTSPHMCEMCGKYFKMRWILNAHIAAVHRNK